MRAGFVWGVMPFLLMVVVALASESEPRIYRYAGWVDGCNGERVQVQNYRFADRILSMRVSDAWWSFESVDADEIRLKSREASDTAIRVLCTPLETVPPDEEAAKVLYRAELAKAEPNLVIRRGRVDSRYIPVTGQFPQTYNLATTEEAPLTRFYTFFIYEKRLYTVSLDTPSRTDIARMFTEYSNLMKSFKVEPRVAEPVPEAVAESAGQPAPDNGAKAAAPEAAPSAVPVTESTPPAAAETSQPLPGG